MTDFRDAGADAPALLPDAIFFDPTASRSYTPLTLPDGTPLIRIPLTGGWFAVLDPEDWDRVKARYGERWYANPNGNGQTYATTNIPAAARRPFGPYLITLQRAVTEAKQGEQVIFRNRCTFDLRRANLYVQNRREAREAVAKYRSEVGTMMPA